MLNRAVTRIGAQGLGACRCPPRGDRTRSAGAHQGAPPAADIAPQLGVSRKPCSARFIACGKRPARRTPTNDPLTVPPSGEQPS